MVFGVVIPLEQGERQGPLEKTMEPLEHLVILVAVMEAEAVVAVALKQGRVLTVGFPEAVEAAEVQKGLVHPDQVEPGLEVR